MAVKIKKLTIQNFKVFSYKEFDFYDSDLIVFDGPNGFGKTSFYDAVELLVTGEIRRYLKLGKETIDGRSNFSENPYLHYESLGGDILIEGMFQKGTDRLSIRRKALNQNLDQSHSFDSFVLGIKKGEEEEYREYTREQEPEALAELLGKNYKENFRFLNYVEQEDSVFLLKNKEKDKRKEIDHLFNVDEFKQEITRLKAVKDTIQSLCNTSSSQLIDNKKVELKQIEGQLSSGQEVPYSRMFPDHDFYWDNELIDFQDNIYTSILGESGELTKLRAFVENKNEFKTHLFNKKVSNITDRKVEIENLLRYSTFLDQKKELKVKKELHNQIIKLVQVFEEITLDYINTSEIIIPDSIKTILSEESIEEFNNALNKLKEKQNTASELDSVLSGLKESRNKLIESFNNYQEKDAQHKECPLCGFEWENAQQLADEIKSQADKINVLLTAGAKELTTLFEQLQGIQIKPIITQLKEYNEQNAVDVSFVDGLLKVNDKQLQDLRKEIDTTEVNISEYLNSKAELSDTTKLDALITELKSKQQALDSNKVEAYFEDIYSRLFINTKTSLENISLEVVNSKISYIEWKYAEHQNSSIAKLKKEITEKEDKYSRAKQLEKDLKKLIRVYEGSKKEYEKKIIKDIEVLFHIYSGRIVQDFQGGLGLFIDAKSGIKFLTDPSKSYDAVFSMSSGQLSALIISFTLALNKKYSQNKLLFIDDPVQTMDEINIAGFIELLRNEFGERQIFISTHEEVMSSYMRYKFKKYAYETLRVNVKEAVN